MAKAEIEAGNCGYTTTVEATANEMRQVTLNIESECAAVRRMAEHLTEVDPFQNISFRRGMPPVLELGATYCSHAACPVPIGIIKAVEVAAGVALPGEAKIVVTQD